MKNSFKADSVNIIILVSRVKVGAKEILACNTLSGIILVWGSIFAICVVKINATFCKALLHWLTYSGHSQDVAIAIVIEMRINIDIDIDIEINARQTNLVKPPVQS